MNNKKIDEFERHDWRRIIKSDQYHINKSSFIQPFILVALKFNYQQFLFNYGGVQNFSNFKILQYKGHITFKTLSFKRGVGQFSVTGWNMWWIIFFGRF